MADTSIEWCDKVWNAVTGCTKVSQGCKHCYAEVIAGRKLPQGGFTDRPFTEVRCHPERLEQPLKWRKPKKIFVNSMSDLFHDQVPFEFIDKVRSIALEAIWHTFLILTKRPKRALEYGEWARQQHIPECSEWPDNVWIGVSVENQAAADERIPLLLQIPAAVRFLSVEPMLGPIDLAHGFRVREGVKQDALYGTDGLRWVICGGESGPGARPMHPNWARSLRDQCQAAGVAFYFKQWGEFAPANGSGHRRETVTFDANTIMHRVGKKTAGGLLDGKEYKEFPTVKP